MGKFPTSILFLKNLQKERGVIGFSELTGRGKERLDKK